MVEYAEAGGVAVRMEVAAGTGQSSRLDTDGDGDVDDEDELPVVRGLRRSEVPDAPQGLGLRVDTESAVDIQVPEELTANGATVRVCLATSLERRGRWRCTATTLRLGSGSAWRARWSSAGSSGSCAPKRGTFRVFDGIR